jgi:hypothetical protein
VPPANPPVPQRSGARLGLDGRFRITLTGYNELFGAGRGFGEIRLILEPTGLCPACATLFRPGDSPAESLPNGNDNQ